MSIIDYKSSASMSIAKQALNYRAMRQDMISSNIANTDTPYYKPRDIRFEDALSVQRAKLYNDNTPQLQMAKTNGAHIELQDNNSFSKPTRFFRDGHMARNDGNSVDLDVETTEMSKNSIMFKALIGAIKKEAGIYRSVIDASSKVQ